MKNEDDLCQKEAERELVSYIPSWIGNSQNKSSGGKHENDSSGFVSPTSEDSMTLCEQKQDDVDDTGCSLFPVARRRSISTLSDVSKNRKKVLAYSADHTRRRSNKLDKSLTSKEDVKACLLVTKQAFHIEDHLSFLDIDDNSDVVISKLLPRLSINENPCITDANGTKSTNSINPNTNDTGKPITKDLKYTKKTGTYLNRNFKRRNDKGEMVDGPGRDVKSRDIFIIPELPSGKLLHLVIHSNWGDKNYIGLNGIEIFNCKGSIVPVEKIWSEGDDLKGKKSRLTNLIDGVTRTRDENHLWRTQYVNNKCYNMYLQFKQTEQLALIRIWNYNKSRIHTSQGIRLIQFFLDEIEIFFGEIIQASGELSGQPAAFGDTILFTTKESILEKVYRNDASFQSITMTLPVSTHNRPMTSDTPQDQVPAASADVLDCLVAPTSYNITHLEITLLSNWGHNTLIGLTGLEFFNKNEEVVSCDSCVVSKLYDCAQAVDGDEEAESCDVVIDGVNITDDEQHMWSTQWDQETAVTLRVAFQGTVEVTGFRLWNYNSSLELSYAGAKECQITLNGKPHNVLLRRAPGNVNYDFVQEINFMSVEEDSRGLQETLAEDATSLPMGFVFELTIFSTWGDPYYVGLNGVEMLDAYGRKVPVTDTNVCAQPSSVNILQGVSNDARTPACLCDARNSTRDGRNSWLAPVLPNTLNRVYFVFDKPVTISIIKIWNYGKTLSRGVKEFAILVDDLLIYNETLPSASKVGPVVPTVINFQPKEKHLMGRASGGSLGVRSATTGGSHKAAVRPHTSVPRTNNQRNHTAW